MKRISIVLVLTFLAILLVFTVPAVISQIENLKIANNKRINNIGENGCPLNTIVIIAPKDSINIISIIKYLDSAQIGYTNYSYAPDQAGVYIDLGEGDQGSLAKETKENLQKKLSESPIANLINDIRIDKQTKPCTIKVN